ncbi:MAG: hypothetical protein IJM74_07115 [Bacteroidales bacterium]|nr:hypothetical protein [Bacteroidales bacterium]MBQ9474137.1 hypothetical protein [Bacteroidales bacterium]
MHSLTLPWSKSIVNRLLVAQHLAGKLPALLPNDGYYADDSILLHRLLQQLEATARTTTDDTETYYCDNCGTAARFMAALLALIPGTHILDGDTRLRQRPMKGLLAALRHGGAAIEAERDYLPCRITGTNLFANDINLDTSESSQYASALLLAAPYIKGGLNLQIANHGEYPSKPYIEMTLKLMQRMGIEWNRTDDTITVLQGDYNCESLWQLMERDWSSAAFCYQAVATSHTGTTLLLRDLTLESLQGDSQTATLFEQLGVESRQTAEGVVITSTGRHIKKLNANLIDTPDLAPALACTAAALGIETHLSGIHTLTTKESNRIEAIASNLSALGYMAKADSDNIYVEHSGNTKIGLPPNCRCNINGYNDHRIIMAFTILTKDQHIVNEHVSKSFPNFVKTLIANPQQL